jgi:hypothetical protein
MEGTGPLVGQTLSKSVDSQRWLWGSTPLPSPMQQRRIRMVATVCKTVTPGGSLLVRIQPAAPDFHRCSVVHSLCAVEQRQLGWLITNRPEVRVFPAQPFKCGSSLVARVLDCRSSLRRFESGLPRHVGRHADGRRADFQSVGKGSTPLRPTKISTDFVY